MCTDNGVENEGTKTIYTEGKVKFVVRYKRVLGWRLFIILSMMTNIISSTSHNNNEKKLNPWKSSIFFCSSVCVWKTFLILCRVAFVTLCKIVAFQYTGLMDFTDERSGQDLRKTVIYASEILKGGLNNVAHTHTKRRNERKWETFMPSNFHIKCQIFSLKISLCSANSAKHTTTKILLIHGPESINVTTR